jgi:hypothetical protein
LDPVQVRRPRVVVGGSAFVAPWTRGVGYLSLGPIEADVTVRSIHGVAGGRASGWEARIHVRAGIPAESTTLLRAAENLLGKNEEEIRLLLRHAVEATVPAVLARLPSSGGDPDWERLAAELESSVAPDLVATGMVVQSLSITGLDAISPDENAPRALAPPTRATPSTLPSEASSDLGIGFRVSRAERNIAILSAEVARLGPEIRGVPETLVPFSLFDTALGYAGTASTGVPGDDAEPSYCSLGDEGSSLPSRPSEEDAVGAEGRDRWSPSNRAPMR